jgi:hypothetical protein
MHGAIRSYYRYNAAKRNIYLDYEKAICYKRQASENSSQRRGINDPDGR